MANRIKLAGTTSNSFQVGINGAILSSTSVVNPYTLTLPANTGVSGQLLSTDGTGNLSWVTGGSGGGGSSISNGSSNVNIATANGNITLSVAGTNNVAQFSNTTIILNPGADVTHGVRIGGSGRIKATNDAAAVILDNGGNVKISESLTIGALQANRPLILTSDSNNNYRISIYPGSNANYSLILPANAGSNRQVLSTDGTGNLSWANTGIVPGSNTQILFNTDGNTDAVAGLTYDKVSNLLTVAGNISAGNISTSGNATIGGNLIVNGNTTFVNIDQLNVANPIIGLGRGPNNSPLTGNDGKDRGEQLWYYTTSEKSAFIGYDNSTGNLIAASDVSIGNEIVTVNEYGTFVVGELVSDSITTTGNVTGGNLVTGGVLSVTGNATAGNLNTATAIITTGNITTINSGLLQNGNSNISITANGNISMTAAGGDVEFIITSTGANVSGTLHNTGNIETDDSIIVRSGDGNIRLSTTENSNILMTMGTTNAVSITSNSIAIGRDAASSQVGNTIVLNASGNSITPVANGLYVTPVRTITNANINDNTSGNLLFYNTSTKEITTQSIPAFAATSSSSITVTAGGALQVPFTNELIDTDNWFASSNFTPQRAGWYQINVACQAAAVGGSSSTSTGVQLRKNDSRVAQAGGTGATLSSVSVLVYLNGTTDYVNVWVTNSAGGTITQSSAISHFSGYWVRP